MTKSKSRKPRIKESFLFMPFAFFSVACCLSPVSFLSLPFLVFYFHEKQPLRRRRRTGLGSVLSREQLSKRSGAPLPSSHFDKRAHNVAHHVSKKRGRFH